MKSFFRSARVQSALAALLAAYLRFTLKTIRWKQEGLHLAEAVWDAGGPVIVCFWHSRISISPACWPLDRAQETANIIADTNTGHALVVTSQLNPPVERATRLTQSFTAATIGAIAVRGAAPAPTRDLVDHRALYHYSPDTTYEHIYINTKWYAYQCIKGVRRGTRTLPPLSDQPAGSADEPE